MKKFKISQYFLKYTTAIFFYVLFTLAGCVCTFLMTIYTAKAIEILTQGDFTEAINWLLIVLGITLVRRLFYWSTGVLYDKYSVKIMSALHLDLAKQAFKLDSRTFSSHNTGVFVQRIVTDPENIVNSLTNVVNMLANVVTSFATIIYIATLNVYIGISIIALLIITITIERFRIKVYKKNKGAVRKESDNITTLTTEIVRSEKDVKSLGLETQLSEVSNEKYSKYKQAVYKHESAATKFWNGKDVLIEVVTLVLLIFAITLMEKSLITLAVFIIIQTHSSKLSEFIWDFGGIIDTFTEVRIASERMFSIFDEKEFTTETFGDIHLDNVKGDIEFKNVCFEYKEYEYEVDKKTKQRTQKLISSNKIFDSLSFKIPKNTTVAFVGKSGSGKSTILNLMAKMLKVDSGEILIDKHNINDLDKETLRSSFSLVNQFPYIFDMTIKENLLLAKNNATEEELVNALEQASLYEFVKNLPKGIDTKVGESGIKLSGGQKQRLAIARALLRKTSIILFDESTSSLDNFAQENIKRSIDSIKGTSTIVIVAHRLSTIKDADVIFFLEDGKILDSGTFDYLYSNNDKFKRMFLVENIENF